MFTPPYINGFCSINEQIHFESHIFRFFLQNKTSEVYICVRAEGGVGRGGGGVVKACSIEFADGIRMFVIE